MPPTQDALTMEQLDERIGKIADKLWHEHEGPDEPATPESPYAAALAQVQDILKPGETYLVPTAEKGFDATTREALFKQVESEIVAKMSAGGLLGPIEQPLNGIGGLPLGSILVGTTTGFVVGEVVDLLTPPRNATNSLNATNFLLKGGLAMAITTFGDQVMSKQATQFAAGTLVVQAVSEIVDLRKIATQIADWIRKVSGGFGSTGNNFGAGNYMHQVDAAASRAWNNYGLLPQPQPYGSKDPYDRLFGG